MGLNSVFSAMVYFVNISTFQLFNIYHANTTLTYNVFVYKKIEVPFRERLLIQFMLWLFINARFRVETLGLNKFLSESNFGSESEIYSDLLIFLDIW